MPDNQDQQLAAIERFAHESCKDHDPAHDIMHVSRVASNARSILRGEPGADPFVTLAAAWLHDIVQLPKGEGRPGESAARSARSAASFLATLGVDDDSADLIAHAVRAHSYSGGIKPASIEAAIVQDADRLDALGAIGIARLWVTAGVLGSRLHHLADPAGTQRELNDRGYGLDHIEAKLLKLPDLMNTKAGRSMAQARAAYVEQFRATFLEELSGKV